MLGNLDIHIYKNETRSTSLTLLNKINSKSVKEPKMQPETLKLLKGNKREYFT